MFYCIFHSFRLPVYTISLAYVILNLILTNTHLDGRDVRSLALCILYALCKHVIFYRIGCVFYIHTHHLCLYTFEMIVWWIYDVICCCWLAGFAMNGVLDVLPVCCV